jgi:hypothetical protein
MIEKKLDTEGAASTGPGTFSLPCVPKRLMQFGANSNTENRLKDEFKKSQKLKKEHRRTRVIRAIPEIDNLGDITNSCGTGNDSVV